MKSIHLTLKKRFAIIVFIIAILVFVLFLTAINQLNKVQAHSDLKDQVNVLADSRLKIDSLQSILFTSLPHDLTFFKTSKSKLIDSAFQNNNRLTVATEKIAANFYLSGNREIKLKTFLISQELKHYNDALEKCVYYIQQKGFAKYGLNGKIDLISEDIITNARKEGSGLLADKVQEISDLKNRYILERDPSLLNKVKVVSDEAKAYAIMSSKAQKLAILTKLQKLEEQIITLGDYDQAIGYTPYDGLTGTMKSIKDRYSNHVIEFNQLVRNKMSKAIAWGYFWLTFLFILVTASIFGLYTLMERFIHKPLSKITKFLSLVVRGILPEKINFKHSDEISIMAQNLNAVIDSLQQKAEFAIEIGERKSTSQYKPLSDDDILGNALIEMEKSLRKADLEDLKYKTEEKKRVWTNEGIAKFGEILRLHNNDINKLADEIIQNLVKYLNALQGALYFYNSDDENNIYLEIIAAYAFDRKKHIKKIISLGEGLVGTVAIEKEKLFITDIPEGYLTITSGLGDAPPRSILIAPLKLENEMLGVVEIASYDILKPHEIEFVEKIGETIASTITSVKINARTAKLLEQSQKQAEDMAEQEEEMRQNMEELRTTQEDFARRETELQGFLNAIQDSTMVMVFDDSGKIIDANDKLLQILHSKRDDIIGRYHREFSSLSKMPDDFEKFWNSLKSGNPQTIIEKIRLSIGKDLYLKQSFSPVLDATGVLTRVLCVSIDITESKTGEITLQNKTNELEKTKKSLDYLSSAIDASLLRCDYSIDGKITDVNENFCRFTGLSKNEIVGKLSTLFLKEDEKLQFEKIWNEVTKNKPYTGAIKRSRPTGEEIWLMASFVPVLDDSEHIIRVHLFAQDITERKLKYQLLEEANKEIDRLKIDKGTKKE
jgi:PAS domain S-box-containing protein